MSDDTPQRVTLFIAACEDCDWYKPCGTDDTEAESEAYDHGMFKGHDHRVIPTKVEL